MRGVRRGHSRFRLLRILPGSSLWTPAARDKRSRSIRMARSIAPAKPAAAGDVISLYGTGVTSGQGGVFVTVGGQDAMVSYTSSGGVTRFDVRIPSGILTSRAVPVVVLINQDAVVASQSGVTVAVQGANQTATNTSIGLATAVTTDPAGNVYFVSSSSVFKVDPKGALTRVAGKLQPGYSGDGGPAIDAQLFTDDLVNEETLFGLPSGLCLGFEGQSLHLRRRKCTCPQGLAGRDYHNGGGQRDARLFRRWRTSNRRATRESARLGSRQCRQSVHRRHRCRAESLH